jgi:G:T/U-mismatch repair DNA glycosylase
MAEFCVKCSEKEAEIEILRKRHYAEMQCMKAKLEKLQNENDALIMDVAFYGGNMINLSCNNK